MSQNLVINVDDLINWLQAVKKDSEEGLKTILTPEEIKSKVLEVTSGEKKATSIVTFKDLLDNIKREAFIQGQMSVYDGLIETLTKNKISL